LNDTVGDHATTIEFRIQGVRVKEIHGGGELLIVELLGLQVGPLFMDLHAIKDTMM